MSSSQTGAVEQELGHGRTRRGRRTGLPVRGRSARGISTRPEIAIARSAASVTAAKLSTALTSSGRTVPPIPARSVARISRSGLAGSGGKANENVTGNTIELSGSPVSPREQPHPQGDQRSRVDFDGDVEVEWTIARLIGVQIDFPRLAVRVGLDEVAFVVNVEPVLGDVVLEIGDEPLEIDDGHGISLPRFAAHPSLRSHQRGSLVGRAWRGSVSR